MKKAFLLLLLLSASSLVKAQKHNYLYASQLRHLKIGAVISSNVVIRDGWISREDSKNTVSLYNEQGQLSQQLFASFDAQRAISYNYTYGSCPEYQWWNWLTKSGSRVDTVQTQQVLFDQDCRQVQIIWRDSTGKVSEARSITYDQKSRPALEIDTDALKKITARVTYAYPDSLTTDKRGFFGDNTFWYHSRQVRDKHGTLVRSISFDKQGKPESSEQVVPVYKGNQVQSETHYDATGKITRRVSYSYNADDLLEEVISRVITAQGDIETISTYRYKKKP